MDTATVPSQAENAVPPRESADRSRNDTATSPARVRALTPLSLCDWPGRSVSVLYLGGCNLRCPTCHNASLAFTPSLHPPLDTAPVLKALAARKRWLDGVVVCGGEPTLDPGLPALVDALTGLGLPVKVDTNGMLPKVVAEVLRRAPDTTFAVDLKGPWGKYPSLTGGAVSPEEARSRLESVFALAAGRPGSFLFRITLVPEITPEDVGTARRCLPAGFSLREQPYSNPVRNQTRSSGEQPGAPSATGAFPQSVPVAFPVPS